MSAQTLLSDDDQPAGRFASQASEFPTGGVWAVGHNSFGQLGLGAVDDDAHPTAVQLAALGSGVVQVAAGYRFSAALTVSGEVYLWGNNGNGRLGDGTTDNRPTPTHITALGTDTVQLALGESHALALKQSGAVFGWGSGGALGLGDTDGRLTPTEVANLGTDNAYITAQYSWGMALKTDGRLVNWGYNNYNQLGDGTTTDRLSPVELAAVGSDNAHVVGGYAHTLLLKDDGSVVSWGYNGNGEIGNGECSGSVCSHPGSYQVCFHPSWPSQVHPCASHHRSTIRVSVSSCVHNTLQATPYTVSALSAAAIQIAAGYSSSYAMLVDGSVWAWGHIVDGQFGRGVGLGDGTTTNQLSPVRIEGYGTDTAMRLPPSGNYAETMFVVMADGTAMGSGWNTYGQLGNGGTDNVVTASVIPELGGGIVQIARGQDHTLVLKSE
jgi:alpha-tubulin suppressor-like RCC1 family protein